MRKPFFIFLGIINLFSFLPLEWLESGWFRYLHSSVFAEELPFKPGEKIVYRLSYKGLKIGKAELTFHGERRLGKEEVYLFTFYTNSLYFKDLEKIFANKDNFLPLKVERKIRGLSSLPTKIEEEYDQDNFRVKIRKKTFFFTRKFTIEKSSPIHNAILLSYLYRKKKEFRAKEEFLVNLPTRSFKLVFKGKERVSTPLGEFLAYLFEGDSSFKFWLKDDEKRIPLKIEIPKLLGYSLAIESIEKD